MGKWVLDLGLLISEQLGVVCESLVLTVINNLSAVFPSFNAVNCDECSKASFVIRNHSGALLGYGLLRFRAIPAFEVVKFSHIMDCDNLCKSAHTQMLRNE